MRYHLFQLPTEYSLLSQQSAMSVRKTAKFLSQNRRSALFWDSKIEGAGPSTNTTIYLGNNILCIFRQPLKYSCFSYSYLDGVREYNVEILDSSL
jgi:hypothetical protein